MSKQKNEELKLDENELAGWVETKMGDLKPYISHIALAVALLFAAFMGISYFINHRQSAYADQWRELSVANTDYLLSQNTSRLLGVAEDFPNQKAAMWSLQIAGDADLQAGLAQLSYDREGGFAVIVRAKNNLKKVVDASSAIKSKELQQRALFAYAYACESLGEFDEARQYYNQLIDESPDSAFAEPAQRGVNRTDNPELIALYKTFKDWKDIADEAPGVNAPTIPNINFDDSNIDSPDAGAEGGAEGSAKGENDFESPAVADPESNEETAATPDQDAPDQDDDSVEPNESDEDNE